MHTISSRFRALFIGKIVFLAIIAMGIIIFFVSLFVDLNSTSSHITMALILCLIIVLSFIAISRILAVMKINILQDKLEVFSFFGKKTEILFSDITKIEIKKVVLRSRAGNITDGYHISILILKNGKSFEISPDEFEKYSDMMAAIVSRRNS